jgi:hypothetical protein
MYNASNLQFDFEEVISELPGTDDLPKVVRLDRATAMKIIVENHYTHRFPSGWVRCYEFAGVVVIFSIPANKNLEPFIFDKPVQLRELARLWAADGHKPFALTQALAAIIKQFRRDEPQVKALVSFADPNQDHHGGIYQAASWTYTGQSSESRAYMLPDGTPVSRRAFHTGSKSYIPTLPVIKLPGKLRYVKFLDTRVRKNLKLAIKPYPKPTMQSDVSII